MDIQELRKYDGYKYFAGIEDAAETLQEMAFEEKDCEVTRELKDAIYYLDAVSQNEYNKDCFRVLYNTIMEIAEKYRD